MVTSLAHKRSTISQLFLKAAFFPLGAISIGSLLSLLLLLSLVSVLRVSRVSHPLCIYQYALRMINQGACIDLLQEARDVQSYE